LAKILGALNAVTKEVITVENDQINTVRAL